MTFETFRLIVLGTVIVNSILTLRYFTLPYAIAIYRCYHHPRRENIDKVRKDITITFIANYLENRDWYSDPSDRVCGCCFGTLLWCGILLPAVISCTVAILIWEVICWVAKAPCYLLKKLLGHISLSKEERIRMALGTPKSNDPDKSKTTYT